MSCNYSSFLAAESDIDFMFGKAKALERHELYLLCRGEATEWGRGHYRR